MRMPGTYRGRIESFGANNKKPHGLITFRIAFPPGPGPNGGGPDFPVGFHDFNSMRTVLNLLQEWPRYAHVK